MLHVAYTASGKSANTLPGLLNCNRGRGLWVATCPTINWLKCHAQENQVALGPRINACSFLSHFVRLSRCHFSSPRGHCSLRDPRVPPARIFTGWGLFIHNLAPPSPIFGAQPPKPGPLAEGSLRPQKASPHTPLGLYHKYRVIVGTLPQPAEATVPVDDPGYIYLTRKPVVVHRARRTEPGRNVGCEL